MIKSITTHLAAWHKRREILRELSLLSDRELADLGIGRGDIRFVADGSFGAVEAPFAADGLTWATDTRTALAA